MRATSTSPPVDALSSPAPSAPEVEVEASVIPGEQQQQQRQRPPVSVPHSAASLDIMRSSPTMRSNNCAETPAGSTAAPPPVSSSTLSTRLSARNTPASSGPLSILSMTGQLASAISGSRNAEGGVVGLQCPPLSQLPLDDDLRILVWKVRTYC